MIRPSPGIGLLLGFLTAGMCNAGEALRFNRDIRPILSSQCFPCHGPDNNARKAGLRLDDREQALRPAESGAIAIVPGMPDESELIRRVLSEDPGERMPPPGSNRLLTLQQKELLSRWVREGAGYERHWALIPPQRAEFTPVNRTAWPRNAVDRFILGRLEHEGFEPSPEADWMTLLRRVSLDLTGLPPTPAEIEAFADELTAAAGSAGKHAPRDAPQRWTEAEADRAYEKWVNRLLASPHFGERMTVDWLDGARFADTNGYQIDRDREMYAWRDYVIAAFNSNMPFDQFTVEQLAGDLLPHPTMQQRIATGFHRNHMLMEEGGVIPEEFLAEYCADRVETTATVWLGQTFNCARCHDHKFDSFTQRDYYGLYAFFHNVTETGIGEYLTSIRRNAPPMLKLPTPEVEAALASLNQALVDPRQGLAEIESAIAAGQTEWEKRLLETAVSWQPGEVARARIDDADGLLGDNGACVRMPAFEAGSHKAVIEVRLPLERVTALRLECRPVADAANAAGPIVLGLGQWRVFVAGADASGMSPLGIRPAAAGDSLPASEVAKALDASAKAGAVLILKEPAGASLIAELDQAHSGTSPAAVRIEISISTRAKTDPWELRLAAADAAIDVLAPMGVVTIISKDAALRSPEEQKQIAEFRNAKDPKGRSFADHIAALTKKIDELELQTPTVMVMQEMQTPRRTHVLMRGAYNNPGAEVTPDTPAALPPMASDLPRNRLGLARWLVDPANPLPARVTVNRYWQLLFGAGLVRTPDDFGVQGTPPTHPELLDWLAIEFIRSGWDVKALLRLLVTSSTYRQSSRLTPTLRDRDPENRLLARGPRFRLQAEFLRDQALAASGLLVPAIGGPSVRPYHPPGLYEQVATPGLSAGTYVAGTGEDLFRRSLYTYWRRSVPNPAMLVFDMPFRESCTVRRTRTNTPLQALNLMNDPTYVEAARFLAERMVSEAGAGASERVAWGFIRVLGRPPRASELAILNAACEQFLEEFQGHPDRAADLLRIGSLPADTRIDAAHLAALTAVASMILNLDEAVTKE